VEPALADEAPSLRFQALIALAKLAPARADRAILDALDDDDDQIRYLAVRLVEEHWLVEPGSSLEDRVAKRVARRLEDAQVRIRLAAAIVLTRAGFENGHEQIARALNTSRRLDDVDDEAAAIDLAGDRGIVAARPGLEQRAFGMLGPRRDGFAWHSRVALARMGDVRAATSIARGLDALSRDTRTFAVAAAGQARLTMLRERIAKMRGDERCADQAAVEDALALLGV
jgi:HEAT repeat protein